MVLKSVTEVLCLPPRPKHVMVESRLEYNCHSVRAFPRKSCFIGEDWVSIWNQQINPRQVSERASLIGSSYWALNHDKMLLLFPCKLAGNIWYFLHKRPIAAREIYCWSYQNNDSLSVPIIGCQWLCCVSATVYNWEHSPGSNKNNIKESHYCYKIWNKTLNRLSQFQWGKNGIVKAL